MSERTSAEEVCLNEGACGICHVCHEHGHHRDQCPTGREARAYRRGQEAMRERAVKALETAVKESRLGRQVPDTSGCTCDDEALGILLSLELEAE